MTETFTASNGMTVERDHNNDVVIDTISVFMAEGTALALREFFQHERDEGLGRWRWPENPDYVVYSNPDEAFERMFGPNLDLVILRDSDGMTKGYVREEDQGGPPMDHRVGHMLAARAYFEAHPERKPWEEAKPGEVWVLTFDGAEDTFKAYESRFGTIYFTRSRETSTDLTDERITAGRRIWPEDAS